MEILVNRSAVVMSICKDGLFDKAPEDRLLNYVFIAGAPLSELIKQAETAVKAHDELHYVALATRSCDPVPLYVPLLTGAKNRNLVAALFAIPDGAKLPGVLESKELVTSYLLIAAFSLNRVKELARQVSKQTPLVLEQAQVNVFRK